MLYRLWPSRGIVRAGVAHKAGFLAWLAWSILHGREIGPSARVIRKEDDTGRIPEIGKKVK